MAGGLEESLRIDLRCEASEAATIAALARERVPRILETAEDSEEDLVVRLRDPRVFGEFAIPLLEDPRLAPGVRTALAERIFDLLPLPRSVGDVIMVEARAPRSLLAAAAFLARTDRLSVLHVLHLVYALFLDRRLTMHVDRPVRSFVLRRILAQEEVNENVRTLYATMHLAGVPEREAQTEFRRLLKEDRISIALRSSLVHVAEAPDAGRTILLAIAQEEGLLPSGSTEPEDPTTIANIPRLPDRLADVARGWRNRGV